MSRPVVTGSFAHFSTKPACCPISGDIRLKLIDLATFVDKLEGQENREAVRQKLNDLFADAQRVYDLERTKPLLREVDGLVVGYI